MALLFSLPLDLLSLLLSDWCRPKDIVGLDGVLKGRWRRIFLSALGTVTDYPPWHARDLISQDISMLEWMRTRNYSVELKGLYLKASELSQFCKFIPQGHTYPFVRMFSFDTCVPASVSDRAVSGPFNNEEFVKMLFASLPNLEEISCVLDESNTFFLLHLVKHKHHVPHLKNVTIESSVHFDQLGISFELLTELGVFLQRINAPLYLADLPPIAGRCPNFKAINQGYFSEWVPKRLILETLPYFCNLQEIIFGGESRCDCPLADIERLVLTAPNLKTFELRGCPSSIQFAAYMIKNCSELTNLLVEHVVYKKASGFLALEVVEDWDTMLPLFIDILTNALVLSRLLLFGNPCYDIYEILLNMICEALKTRRELEVLEILSSSALLLTAD